MDEREAHPRERGEAVTPARVVGSGIEEFRGDFIVVTVTSKARRRVQAYEKPSPSAGIAESWPGRPTGLPALTGVINPTRIGIRHVMARHAFKHLPRKAQSRCRAAHPPDYNRGRPLTVLNAVEPTCPIGAGKMAGTACEWISGECRKSQTTPN
jgi:hypothetical protein